MSTREELFAGIIRMNDERIDRQSPAKGSTLATDGGGLARGAKPTAEPSPREAPAESAVPAGKESVWEYASRRQGEIRNALEENEDEQARLTAALEGLRKEREGLEEEQLLLAPLVKEEVDDRTDDSEGCGEPEDVPEDTEGTGGGRSSKVRGRGSWRKDSRYRKAKPPEAS